jgi:hypothetical protein
VEAGLVVVDPDAGRDVHRRDEHHPLGDAGLVDGGRPKRLVIKAIGE